MRLHLLWLAFALVCIPIEVSAQATNKIPVLGVLMVSADPNDTVVEALRKGLRELGYAEDRNVRIEYRGAHGDVAQLPRLASELVQLKVDAIVAGAEPSVQAARQATDTIPIVMAMYDYDPVDAGLVESLRRPGGNVTGVFSRQSELAGKRLELIKEALPRATRVAVVWDKFSWRQLEALATAAKSLGLQLLPLELKAPYDYDSAFKSARRQKAGAALILFSPVLYAQRVNVEAAARKYAVPTVSQERDFVVAGGLMSYGPGFEDVWGRAAYFIDRLLKGAKPSELPVEQPSTLRLTVNLQTAKALKVSLPESILLRADEVIR